MAATKEHTIRKYATEVVIANGDTVSSAADLFGTELVAVETPAALTGTSFTFQGSSDGTTYVQITDKSGAAVTLTVATSKIVTLGDLITNFAGIRYVKVVSGSSEGAARTIKLLSRPL